MGCILTKSGDLNREFRDHYVLGKKLAEGTFGVVHACTEKKGEKKIYAVKLISVSQNRTGNASSSSSSMEASHEAKMMKKFDHPNVLRLIESFRDKYFEYIVMEKLFCGFIDSVQTHLTNGIIADFNLVPLFRQMATSVQHLHHLKFIHRDVKADNFLLDRFNLFDPQCRVVLCDMGTVVENPNDEYLTKQLGTKLYWSPEMINKKYSFKVDVFALGVCGYGSLCGCFPFATMQHTLRKSPNLSSNKALSPSCIEWLTALLTKDEDKRPDIDQVLEMKWLSGAEIGSASNVLNQQGNMEIEDITTREFPKIDSTEDEEHKPFSTTEKEGGTIREWEWWKPEHLGRQLGPSHLYTNKQEEKQGTQLSLSWSKKVLENLFVKCGISLDKFGINGANSIEDILEEVTSGQCLFLEEEGGSKLLRQVTVVVVRLGLRHSNGQLLSLVEKGIRLKGGPERSTKRLPGTKKRPGESVKQAASRCLVEYLRLEPSSFEILAGDEKEEVIQDSPAYPEVRTLYLKHFVTAEVKHSPEAVERLNLDSGKDFVLQSEMGDTRTWSWWPKQHCDAENIVMNGQVGNDFHFTRATPIDTKGEWTIELLIETLKEGKVDVSSYGTGTAYSLENFKTELDNGAASLMRGVNGELVRVVDVVTVRINSPAKKVLLERKTRLQDGRVLVRNRLPGTKRLPNENVWQAAGRVVAQFSPNIRDNVIIRVGQEETQNIAQESGSYPGIQTVYRKTFVTADYSNPNLADGKERI